MSPDIDAYNIIENYLDKVIRDFSLEGRDTAEEKDRKAQTLLGALIEQRVPLKVIKDQMIAVIVGGRVRKRGVRGIERLTTIF